MLAYSFAQISFAYVNRNSHYSSLNFDEERLRASGLIPVGNPGSSLHNSDLSKGTIRVNYPASFNTAKRSVEQFGFNDQDSLFQPALTEEYRQVKEPNDKGHFVHTFGNDYGERGRIKLKIRDSPSEPNSHLTYQDAHAQNSPITPELGQFVAEDPIMNDVYSPQFGSFDEESFIENDKMFGMPYRRFYNN